MILPGALALIILIIASGALSAGTPGLPADFTSYTSIAYYGAKPGGPDCTSAIEEAIQAARSTDSKCVYVPAGVYQCGPLVLDGVKLVGAGSEQSTFIATDPAHAVIQLSGQDSGIFNLKLFTEGKKRVPGQDRIQVDSTAKTFYVNNVTVDGSNAAGIIVYGGSSGRITGNRIINTKADAIHLTDGAHGIYVAGNYVRKAGDDCIAVVSYDKAPSTLNADNILIENNDVGDQLDGRGISVIGGDHVTIRGNKITKTAMAGIYLVSETFWHTRGISQVLVENNTLDLTPYVFPEKGHPAILVYSDTQYAVTEVKILNNTIKNAPNGTFRIGPGARNIFCSGNTKDGHPAQLQITVTTPITGATITSSLLDGTTVPLPAVSEKSH